MKGAYTIDTQSLPTFLEQNFFSIFFFIKIVEHSTDIANLILVCELRGGYRQLSSFSFKSDEFLHSLCTIFMTYIISCHHNPPCSFSQAYRAISLSRFSQVCIDFDFHQKSTYIYVYRLDCLNFRFVETVCV